MTRGPDALTLPQPEGTSVADTGQSSPNVLLPSPGLVSNASNVTQRPISTPLQLSPQLQQMQASLSKQIQPQLQVQQMQQMQVPQLPQQQITAPQGLAAPKGILGASLGAPISLFRPLTTGAKLG